MNVTEALNARFSCRSFLPKPVDNKDIIAVLEAASHSPSWADTQPWEVFVASGDPLERIRRAYLANLEKGIERRPDVRPAIMWPAAEQERMKVMMASRMEFMGVDVGDKTAMKEFGKGNYTFFGAPSVAFLCLDKELTPWSMFDLGLYAQSLMLAATERGLGSIVAMGFAAYPDILRPALKVPDSLDIVIGIAIGHIDQKARINSFRSPRKPAIAPGTIIS